MNPKYGDVYKWHSTEFKVMYIGPGKDQSWMGHVLTNDEGQPSQREKVTRDWVGPGVRMQPMSGTGWEKVDAPE